MTLTASGTTSFPMPSPGIIAIRFFRLTAGKVTQSVRELPGSVCSRRAAPESAENSSKSIARIACSSTGLVRHRRAQKAPDWHLLSSTLAYLTSGLWENSDSVICYRRRGFCRRKVPAGYGLVPGPAPGTQGYLILWDRRLLRRLILFRRSLQGRFTLCCCGRTVNRIRDH